PSYYPSGIMDRKPYTNYPFGLGGKEFISTNYLDEYFFDARTMYAIMNRFNQVDPLCEKYYSVSPYAYCNNNPVNCFDPDGKDWYRVQNKYGEWEYKYADDIHSQNDLNKIAGNGIYLGKTHTESNTYYSLFGSQIAANSFEGIIYQKVDAAIIKEANARLEKANNWESEGIGSPTTDFSVSGMSYKDTEYLGMDTHRNEYSINYENSSSGVYRVVGGKNSMKAYMEDWIGDKGMPKHIGGWQNGKKMYHLRFQNKKGFDIVHLQYSQQSGFILLQKYKNLFGSKKK
ncbi:RHS repeat-associated core domain-containing protein, partial [Bacteroides sp.]|uniref:RHS repeat-associated core domain-containing protein n=1 Tax=Bacteroides sp. TaxID=29523 RepID=UPI0025BE63A5